MAKTSGTLLTPADLVARWRGSLTEKTLRNWRYAGRGPTPTKIGRRVFYDEADVIAYEKKSRKSASA